MLLTAQGNRGKEFEVLGSGAISYQNQMQPSIVEMAKRQKTQGAAVTSARCDYHHDALVTSLQNRWHVKIQVEGCLRQAQMGFSPKPESLQVT